MFKRIALLMILATLLSLFSGCSTPDSPVEYQVVDSADAVVHESYECVYDMIGRYITIDMVQEDENGIATVLYEGKTYTLGMDFLSMAMVYNCTPAGEFTTQEQVYNQWWKLYIQRWNYLAPEAPLYANRYYDLHHAKLLNFTTSPYWNAFDAIVSAKVREGQESRVALGVTSAFTGAFRDCDWGKTAISEADRQIEKLTTGYATLVYNKNGDYIWNEKALAKTPEVVKNEDGTLTYTMQLRVDMFFSDGTPIKAQNYVAPLLANSSVVGMAAGGNGSAGMQLVGYHSFLAYDGTNDGQSVGKKNQNGDIIATATAAKYFRGIRLLDDYTFSVTFAAEYADYYYVKTYASFVPSPLPMYLGNATLVTDDSGCCGLSDAFYEQSTVAGVKGYTVARAMVENLQWDSSMPYSGPYIVSHYDGVNGVVTLARNPNYPGDSAREKASIETITVVKINDADKLHMFTDGTIDVAEGITGSEQSEAALALVASDPSRYAQIHYDRAGYGKLAFRCDLGPTSFVKVRQAILYTLDREKFLSEFTKGHGTLVHGPYQTEMTAYKVNADNLKLNTYAYSKEMALLALIEGGWTYNGEGRAFTPGKDAVRYKKLEGYELTRENIFYASTDGQYKTVKIGGEYYMPLVLNWYGTQPNKATDLLIQQWQETVNATAELGMHISYTSCELTQGVYGDYRQREQYGWNGKKSCTCINYASGFHYATGIQAAIYDQSFYWTINPDLFDYYSANYIRDEADFWTNYQ